MSSSLRILIKDGGDSTSLAQEIARVLQADGFLAGRDGNVLSIDTRPWINREGVGVLDLKPIESAEDDEPGEYDGTAYAPYDHELTIEFHSGHGMARSELRDRLGRALFDRIATLDHPLAYGEVGGDLFADFLPGRGIRYFPPNTDYEEPGRSIWFEPRLHGNASSSEPIDRPERLRGKGMVFEREGLLQVVPLESTGREGQRFLTPVASIRTDADPARIGRLIVRTLGNPSAEGSADPTSWITGITRRTADEFSREAISIDLKSDGNVITARPHHSYTGTPTHSPTQGQEVEALDYQGDLPRDDAELGKLLLTIISALRHDTDEKG